ncbi:MFS transporter [bacterium]|nr:MAG: MFS transporter [bacterium]
MRKPSPLTGIFLTVLIDLLGFGMVIPDLQLRGERLAGVLLKLPQDQWERNATVGLYVGALLGGFSLAQLIANPFLGRLSDRIGRRKVLLVTTALSIAGSVFYAHADTYWFSFVARLLAGFAAANLGVAFAYVADVTTPENRASGVGKIGMALGLGFIFGPVLGATILSASGDTPLWLGYVAAILSTINLLYIWFFLPESHVPGENDHTTRKSFFQEVGLAVRTPSLRLLFAMFFAFNFAFAMLQTTFFRLLADNRGIFDLSDNRAKQYGAWILALVGLIGAVMQGGVLPRIVSRFGEANLLRVGFVLLIPALGLLPWSPLWIPVIGIVVLQGVGTGLSQPSLSSLVSRNAPKEIQGGIFGITQSLGSLARLVGPVVSNPLFAREPWAPYAFGAIVLLFPAYAAWHVRLSPDGSG